jgi:hypothetical protein
MTEPVTVMTFAIGFESLVCPRTEPVKALTDKITPTKKRAITRARIVPSVLG